MIANISIFTVYLVARLCAGNKINHTPPGYVGSKCRMQVYTYLSLRTFQELGDLKVYMR